MHDIITFSFQDTSARLALTPPLRYPGVTTDRTLLGWIYDFFGRGALYSFQIGYTFPTLQKPYYACTHTLVLCMPAFYSASKTYCRKNPTHMSLPATWWLLSTTHQQLGTLSLDTKISCLVGD
jgi:hypothetical protein